MAAAVFAGGSQPNKAVSAAAKPALTAQAPPATVAVAAYDAKMLALANTRPQDGCGKAVGGSDTKAALATGSQTGTSRAGTDLVTMHVESKNDARRSDARGKGAAREAAPRPCLKPLWPVHTVYPEAGALLPFKRIVAYYGNFYSQRMGILGEYPPDKVVALLKAQAAAWAEADPTTPVMLAVDYIAVSAQGEPGRGGKYIMRMPPAQIDKAVNMGEQIGGLVFLDVQPGWSTVQTEVPLLASYLKLPNVELALDPEFALSGGKRPGAWRGTLNAADINFAARFLANIVRENHLPPKILVVHRFTERMVTDYHAIKPLPEVEILMDMDGFGSPSLKLAAYRDFIARQPVQFTGFKLFYKNDVKWGGRVMTPAEVLRLSPRPIYILYQ